MSVGEDLDTMLARRDNQHRGLQQQAPFVRTNPSSLLRGNMASTQILTYGKPPVQLALWPGEDQECTAVTTTFYPFNNIFNFTDSSPEIRPFGVIRFGTRGTLAVAEVDIIKGCTFTVVASQVVLEAVLDTAPPPTSPGGNLFPQISFTGMLSFGSLSSHAPVTRSLYFDDVPNSSTGPSTKIPTFAKSVQVIANEPTGTFVIQFHSTNQTVATYTLPPPATTQLIKIPIPGNAVFFDVGYTGIGGPTADIVAIFELNL